jgi:hypothetical protein
MAVAGKRALPLTGSARCSLLGEAERLAVGQSLRKAPKLLVQPHIAVQAGDRAGDEPTAFEIKRLVDLLAEIDVMAGRPDSHSGWYSRLYHRYRVTSYKLIPVEFGEGAIQWLRQQVPQQRSKIRGKAPDEWRQQLYKSIWSKAGRLGLAKQEVYDLAFRRLALKEPIVSLKELGEQKLNQFYDIIIRM